MWNEIKELLVLGWKAAGVMSRIKFIAGLCGMTAIALTPIYWAGVLGISPQAALVLGAAILCICCLTTVAYLGHLAGKAKTGAEKARLYLPCEFLTLERLGHLVEHLKADALGYNRYSQEMRSRVIEMEDCKGIFLGTAFKDSYTMFLYGIQCLIGNKQLQSEGKERIIEIVEQSKENLAAHYPELRKALDHDYAKRRAERR